MTDKMAETDFYYPLLFVTPAFDDEVVDCPPFHLARRKWDTSTFDLATLATKHKLHLPYQAMDVFLSRCNLELRISGKLSLAEANEAFQTLRVALYSSGVSPFLSPFVATYSINDYSGINSRDSETLRSKMYPGMEVGLTSDAGKVEAWPFELSFQCIVVPGALSITGAHFAEASTKAAVWERLLVRFPQLKAIVDAAGAAPMLISRGQSLLHIWSALEALFPTVSTEVSFRIALYIAQLTSEGGDRLARYERVRTAYNIRSKVAHGARASVTVDEWSQAWGILMDSLNALSRREHLPSERELLSEILK
ncbi:MAG: HEPN domain-containing protein [Acidobacteria bacterium]|nr:HEPN domain-containing protein [Acidobacteriota bacterium]